VKTTRLATVLAITTGTVIAIAGCTPVAETTPGETAAASTFPEKDIRLIIQANPGGGSDLSSRALATELEKLLGVSVIPENMPGASGALAMEYVAQQPADGHVIGFGPVEIAMLNTTQNANVLPENFDLIGQIMLAPGVISVGVDSPYETLEDLIEASKDGAVTVANSGTGSIWEAATLGIAEETGAKFTPVSYDGGATAVSAAASGEAVAAVSGAGEAVAQAGAVRVLAVLNDEAYFNLPDVPTAEDAIGTSLEYGGWGGIYAPAGLPDDVRAILEKAVADAVETDSYADFQEKSGNLVVYRDSEEFTGFVNDQFDLFKSLLGS
jgi:tripartite-type tricarboxylate transporter receptor subunit TctC